MGIGKKIIALFILSLTLPSLWGQVIDSPDGNLKLSFDVNNNGTPIYSLDYKNKVCLLYTSPSPRDRQKSRMPSSA